MGDISAVSVLSYTSQVKSKHSGKMVFALVLVSAVISLATSAVVPPGVSLAACPHYPVCDVLVDPLTGLSTGDPRDFPDYVPVNARLPAGVLWSACPNYPFCDININPKTGLKYGAPVPLSPVSNYISDLKPSQLPRGINIHTCPNYPYCF